MSDETKYTIGSGKASLGTFTAAELIARYRSLAECEGIWVEIAGQPQPLWNAITKWHGAQQASELREVALKPVLPARRPTNVEDKQSTESEP